MDVKFLIVGDCAVSVQMGSEISLDVNEKVRKLFTNLNEKPVDGIVEMVPTYASLMIHYRPEKISYNKLKKVIELRMKESTEVEAVSQIVKEIPICYGGELGPDLEDCAAFEDVSVKEFIRMHSEHEYYTYMLGFAPGHAYKARFEEPFHFKRREQPRIRIPGGSIVAQLNLSNFIPFPQPCGWNIIGGTPLTVCDYHRADPFLVHAGEWVKYMPVTKREYDKIKKDAQKGRYQVKTYTKKVVK